MKKMKVFLMFLVVMSIAIVSCKKDFNEVMPINHLNSIDPAGPILKMGGTKYVNGDTIWVVTNVQGVYYIDNPTPGSWYDWDFCGTVFTGSAANLQINITYLFTTTTTCVMTVTVMPADTTTTVTIMASPTNPLVQPLYFVSSSQNTDGTYSYLWKVRKDRISDLVGTPFQIGDHTAWLISTLNVSTTPADTFINFNYRAYNQMMKFNAGRGTTFSDVTGSTWAALAWPADNNYQVYLEDGVVHTATYAPTSVSPGLVGDNAGPFRATVDAININTFFQVSNFVAGAKDNPYFNYQIGITGTWSGNTPISWFNGYGWTFTPIIPIASVPPGGTVISMKYGADGGEANMATSAFYVPGPNCIQFQVTMIMAANPNGGNHWQISRVALANGTYYDNRLTGF